MVVALIIVMLSTWFFLRSPIRWEFGDYFICMGASGGDIHFTGFQATGFNRSRTGINSIQGHLVSKIDNSISDTMHFVIDGHIVLPSDTTGIPPGASFNISVPLRDPTPLSENEFLRKWSGFRFVVDIEGCHYERSFSRREVSRQIEKFRQEVNPAPRPEVRMRKPVAIQPVTVTLQLAAPVLVPNGGTFSVPLVVTITNMPSEGIAYFTCDDTNPKTSNTRRWTNSGSFTLDQSATVNVATQDKYGNWSGIATAYFAFNNSTMVTSQTITICESTIPLLKKGKFNNSFIIINNDISLNASEEITISLKILFYDIEPKGPDYDWQAIIQKSHYNDSYGLMLCTGRVDLNRNDKMLSFYLNGCTKNRIDYYWNDLKDNHWYHIVCIYDGNEATIYIDGTKCVSSLINGKINVNDQDVYVGIDSKSNYPLKGEIENLRIINRALSGEELKHFY